MVAQREKAMTLVIRSSLFNGRIVREASNPPLQQTPQSKTSEARIIGLSEAASSLFSVERADDPFNTGTNMLGAESFPFCLFIQTQFSVRNRNKT